MWKRHRLDQLGIEPPEALSFVPVNFETKSWVEEIVSTGFDRTRPAVVSSTGVTNYLSVDAIQAMLRDVARLAPGSVFVCGFGLPRHLIEPDERCTRRSYGALQRGVTRGSPLRARRDPRARRRSRLYQRGLRDGGQSPRSLLHRARRWTEARKFSRLLDRVVQA